MQRVLFAATQDVAVDGLAIELLSPRELGWGNAAQVVGYKVGMLTGGGLLVWASTWIGWRGLFAAMAALVTGGLAIALVYREPEVPPEATQTRRSLREITRTTWRAARTPGMGWVIAFVGTYKLGETMADAMFKPFLVDAGFAPATIGLWVGTWGMAASLFGSLCGGALAARVPLLPAVAGVAALRCVPLAGQWWLSTSAAPTAPAVVAVTLTEHLVGGALTTVMFAFMMARVDRRVAATHYTLLASVEVIGKSPGAWASGVLAEALGYAGLFALATGLSVAFLTLILPLRRPAGAPAAPV